MAKPDGPEKFAPRQAQAVATRPIPAQRTYAPEALDFAQRWSDLEQTVNALQLEIEQWRLRALDGEAEIKRLRYQLDNERRESDDKLSRLVETSGREVTALTEQREYWRGQYTRVETNLTTAGKIILSCLNDAAPKVDAAALAAVADAIEKPTEPTEPPPAEEPLPRAVTQGPRETQDDPPWPPPSESAKPPSN